MKNNPRSKNFAISDRVILNHDGCSIWSLSPSDRAFEAFLLRIGSLVPKVLEAKRRIPSLTPNDASVVLFVKVDQTAILLGADLEWKGWLDIFVNNQPLDSKASVFKVPHHGSEDAHEDRVWTEMLNENPIAALAPWRRGGSALPTEADIRRILTLTEKAYITAPPSATAIVSRRRRIPAVERTIRESGVTITSLGLAGGMIRMRRKASSLDDWRVEEFGAARRLMD